VIAGIRARIAQQQEAIATARVFAEGVASHYPDLTAIVFGSFARGDFHDGSDIDLLLVSDAFPADPMERQRVLYELSPGGIDIFAYTRSEHAGMLARNHPTVFWARQEGRVVWPAAVKP
jgi:predicted nucleotidyltransferase